MEKYESSMMLWNFFERAEKERLLYQFTQIHGDYFSRNEFFELLSVSLPILG